MVRVPAGVPPMMSLVRAAGLFALTALVAVTAGRAPAAPQAQIDVAIEKGVKFLAGWVGQNEPTAAGRGDLGIGPHALVGIALVESISVGKMQPTDPAIQKIAAAVREAALTEGKTYQASLCLIFLDRLEDPADVPLIQVLAVRLLVGQTPTGGWDYPCGDVPLDAELRDALRGRKLGPGVRDANGNPQLHPAVAAYYRKLAQQFKPRAADDNSNTQFGVLATWTARKHGVPVDAALDRVAARFAGSRNPDGGWTYVHVGPSRPSMGCAGLLAMATWAGRRDEVWAARDAKKKEKQAEAAKDKKGDEPFFTPAGPKADKQSRRPVEENDGHIAAAFEYLGNFLAGGGATQGDLYFLWSLERVGVLYNRKLIGRTDWYDVGSTYLVREQKPEGHWSVGAYGNEVLTSFAVLFLLKADLAKDLSGKMQGKGEAELSGKPGGGGTAPDRGGSGPRPSGGATTIKDPPPDAPLPTIDPLQKDSEAARLGAAIAEKFGEEFDEELRKLRDAKGAAYTAALVQVIIRVDGERLKRAREALAERFCRMSAKTLTGMMKADSPELRRAAVLAAAMNDDKTLVPDLIARIADDDEDLVIRAARAGLVSLTGSDKDLGPADGAGKDERKAAAAAWKAYWEKNKP